MAGYGGGALFERRFFLQIVVVSNAGWPCWPCWVWEDEECFTREPAVILRVWAGGRNLCTFFFSPQKYSILAEG